MPAPMKSLRPKKRPNRRLGPDDEGSTRSPDGLTMQDRAELEKMRKLRRASALAGRERATTANDPRLPGAAKRKAANKKGLQDLLDMMDEPVKKAYGGKMEKVKKMDKGGPTREGTISRRINQLIGDERAIDKKFAERGTSGAAEAEKQKRAASVKAGADLGNVDRYGKDAPKGRSFGQKTKPKKVKKMASGGNVCRGMGAAKRGGNFVVG